MEWLHALWQTVWGEDLPRDAQGRSGTLLLTTTALLLPFGWVLLLLRFRPVRLFLRSLRRS